MTDALNPTVPAGWYPDPWGSSSQRWWDGTAWTGNLDPQPEAAQMPSSPAPALQNADAGASPLDAGYEPVAVRSTYEPVSAYPTAAAPTLDSPYPSRRALRELATGLPDEGSTTPAEDAPSQDAPMPELQPAGVAATADALPAFSQASEFSPEPIATFPPPADVGTATTTEADDGWAASLARWDDVDTTTPPSDAAPIFGDAPPVSYSQRAMRYQPAHGRTSPVWLIVFMPILQSASVLGSTFLFPGLLQFDAQFGAFVPTGDPMTTLTSLRDWVLFAAIPLSVAFFLFTLILGFQDRARLRLLGHDQTASPWWIVLAPLVYLIVRSVRVRQCTGRRGSGPLTTYICLYIAPSIAFFVAQAVSSALYGAIPA